MREFNDNFLAISAKNSKTPRYVIEISFDDAFTDLHYFTDSADTQYPPAANVITSSVSDLSGTSQKINPIKFISSIGSINFKLLDKDKAVTALFNSKLDSGDGLREKRIRVYLGFDDMAWGDYEVIQTQIISNVVCDSSIYKITCSDINRIAKKNIFDLAKTNIQTTVERPPETSLAVAITTTTGFSTIAVRTTQDADGAYVFSASGAILIDGEIITYTGRTATTFTGCLRGSANPYNTVSATHAIDSAVYQTIYTISVFDTSDFELNEHDANYTDEPNQTVGYIKIDEEVIRYTGKTATTFTGCVRGALDTKPAVHEADQTKDRVKRPEVEEYVYIETNAVKLVYGILLGAWYNNPTAASLPANWHLGIDTIWVRNADLYDIGDDLWDNSVSNVNTGFKVLFKGVGKQDGKRFVEREIMPLIGCFMPIYSEGDIGLKRMSGVLSDAPYVIELNSSNINQNSSLAVTHNQKAVANEFKLKWNWSELRQNYTRPITFIDATSIAIHKDSTPIELNFRGLYGNIHTEATVKNIIQRLRDRYAAPPIEMTVSCLPSLHGLEVGDIVKVDVSNIRDYTADSEILSRSFEIQQVSVNWKTGNVRLNLFGSSAKPSESVLADNPAVLYSHDSTLNGAIDSVVTTIPLTSMPGLPTNGTIEIDSESITYASISSNNLIGCVRGVHGTSAASHVDASPVHNSYYTDQGGINIKSLASYSANSINSESITGGATMSSGVYYHTGPLTINTGQTLSWTNNLLLLIEGHVTWNGFGSSVSGGYTGALAGDRLSGTPGYLGGINSGGGVSRKYIETTLGVPSYHPYTPLYGARAIGKSTIVDYSNIQYNGLALQGLPTNLIGSSGRGGGSSTVDSWLGFGSFYVHTAKGGAGGTSGGGLMIISKGGSFGASASINLSGGSGSLGDTVYPPYTGGLALYGGAGAGGAPGCLYWVLDGSGATVPDIESKLIANHGACPVNPSGVLLNEPTHTVFADMLSGHTSNGDTTPSSAKSASRVQFLSDYADEGADDNELTPAGPTNLAATSNSDDLLILGDGTVITRIKLTWTPSTDQNIDSYNIYYHDLNGDNVTRKIEATPSRSESSVYIQPVIDGHGYILFIAGVNTWGVEGNAVFAAHTVVGKTTAPAAPTAVTIKSDPAGVRVEWLNPADKDLAVIEIYQSSANTIPVNPLYRVAASRHSTNQYFVIPLHHGSSKYYWVKAVDSTENKSTAVASTPALFKRPLEKIINPTNTFDQENTPLGSGGDIWKKTSTGTQYRNDPGSQYIEFTTALTADDADFSDAFGASVAVSGDGLVMAVGAPSAAGGGKVYIKDWNADTSAWDLRRTGDERVTNGRFGRGISGWSDVSTGTGSIAWNPLGYLDLISVDGSNRAHAKQSFTVVVGKTYIFKIDHIDTDQLGMSLGSVDNGTDYASTASVTIETKVFIFEATTSTVYLKLSGLPGAATTTVDNVTLFGVAVITQSDGLTGDEFGASVSLSYNGDVISVGAPKWGPPRVGATEAWQGAIYIYDWDGYEITERVTALYANDAGAGYFFGHSCSLSGDGTVLAVGSPEWFNGSISPGAVYLYDWDGAIMNERASKVTATYPGDFEYFGSGCNLTSDGGLLIVGAQYWDGSAGIAQGAAYIYEWDGETMIESQSEITASDAGANDWFGSSVSIANNGKVIVVGAYGWDGSAGSQQGALYIYDRNELTITERVAGLTPSDAGANDAFGYSSSVSSDGAVIAAGAFFWDGPAGSDQGAVYVFNTEWKPISDQTGSHILETFSDVLVIDGDMERPDSLYWSGTSVIPSKDTSEFRYGARSLKVTSTSLSQQSFYNGDKLFIPVESDETYRIKYWGKVASGTLSMRIYFYAGDKIFLTGLADFTTSSASWVQVTATGQTIPANTRYMVVGVKMLTAGTAYMDAAFVKRE